MDIKNVFESLTVPADLNIEEVQEFIKQLTKIGIEHYSGVDTYSQVSQSPVLINEYYKREPPSEPMKTGEMVEFVKSMLPDMTATNSKRFLGYVPSDPNPHSVAISTVTGLLNQFTGSVQGSPSGVAIEALVIKWICQLLDYPSSSFGTFASGGSMANLTAIYTGIVHQMRKHGIDYHEEGLFGGKRPVFYFSDQTHNAIEKALMVLGLGRRSMRILRSNANFELTADSVKKEIENDLNNDLLPLMIIGTAGTTNTGSVDHLADLRELATEYNLWFHIDGAYGAFTYMAKHEEASKTIALPSADSIALDCHKWLYTPFEAGIALVKDHMIMKQAFSLSAQYLKDSEVDEDYELQRNFREYSIQLSRELRGLKVWGVINGLGVEGIRNAITRDILKAEYLELLLSSDERFHIISRSLGIVCFQYKGSEEDNLVILHQINNRGKFFTSSTKLFDKTVIRVCFVNRRSSLKDVEELMIELDEIVKKL